MIDKVTIVYFFVYMFEGVFLWKYCTKLFDSSYRLKKLFFIEICYNVLFLTSLKQNIMLNIIFFATINYCVLYIIYKVKWNTAMVHALGITILMEISELLIFCITSQTFPIFSNHAPFSNLLFNTAISKLVYYFSLNILLHFIRAKKGEEGKFDKIFIYIIIIPFISIFIISTFIIVIIYMHPQSVIIYLILVCTIIVTSFNLIVIYLYSYIIKKNNDFTNLQLRLQKENDFVDYYKMLIQKNEDQNIIIHDIKKHLQTILILNEHHENNKITNYINQIIQSSDLNAVMHICDNELLNAIANRYRKDCQRNNIDFYADIRSHTIDFMNEKDLTSLFCNLFDNAFEATLRQKNSFIELNIENIENMEFTIITMVNSCEKNPFSSKEGKLLSNKKDKLRHGFGMRSIRRVVDTYDGKMQTYYDEESSTFHIIIMLKSSKGYL